MWIEYDLVTKEITRWDSEREMTSEELAAYSTERPGFGAVMATTDIDANMDAMRLVFGDPVLALPALAMVLEEPEDLSVSADGVETITWFGLPEGAYVYIDGNRVGPINDGIFELGATDPGIYAIRLVCDAYAPRKYKVAAT